MRVFKRYKKLVWSTNFYGDPMYLESQNRFFSLPVSPLNEFKSGQKKKFLEEEENEEGGEI